MSGSNTTKNIDDARRFLWEEDEAVVAGASSSRDRQSITQPLGFSTRDFAVDQSVNLMDLSGGATTETRRFISGGPSSGMVDSGAGLSSAIAGLFRSSANRGGSTTISGYEYGDAAPSADAEEYISSDKQRRLSPVCSTIANRMGKVGLRGTKLVMCLMIGFALLGGGLFMIFSNFDEWSTVSSSGGKDSGTDSTDNVDAVRFNQIKQRIVEARITPSSLLESASTPQHKALVWIVREDPAKLSSDHSALLDRYSLAAFYFGSPNSETGGWTNSDGWMSKKGICAWHGIECVPREQEANEANNFEPYTGTYDDNDRVTAIMLGKNDMEGEIPDEWGLAFDRLVTLDLQDNKLSHMIPTTLGNLENLRNLLVRNNKISGTLPTEFGALSNLHQLNLGKNDLHGPIPASWSNLKEIRNFAVSSNLLTGTIPDFSTMTHLLGLYLDDNDFVGALPEFIHQLTDLMDLHLSRNGFSGEISSLETLKNIETIHLDENEFRGTLPDMFDMIYHLKEFLVQTNNFSGPIPHTLTHLQSIKELSLAHNEVNGTIPEGLGVLTDVITIRIHDNKLTGPIPTLLGKLDDIVHLSLNNNLLTGTIPSEVAECFRLKEVHFSNNKLRGEIPTEIGRLSQLEKLHLEYNDLKGVTMPPQVCALRQFSLGVLVSDCAQEDKVICDCCSDCL